MRTLLTAGETTYRARVGHRASRAPTRAEAAAGRTPPSVPIVDGHRLVRGQCADPKQQGELVPEVRLHHLRAVGRDRERDLAVGERSHRVAQRVLVGQGAGEEVRARADLQDVSVSRSIRMVSSSSAARIPWPMRSGRRCSMTSPISSIPCSRLPRPRGSSRRGRPRAPPPRAAPGRGTGSDRRRAGAPRCPRRPLRGPSSGSPSRR